MTEPSGHRRRRRRSSSGSGGSAGSGRSGEPGTTWASPGRRSLVAVGVIATIVVIAIGLSIALSGSPGPVATPSQSSNASDLPLVSVEPTLDASFPPVSTGTPKPSGGVGIRAERIQIVRLGIDLPIVEGDGIDAPINKAAHYPGSGWPDAGTNIYIYGHARVGMFLSLWDVVVGDTVVLTLVDGTQRTYEVGEVLPEVPWNALTYLDPTPTEQLTLQTSTSYHATSPRFIAIAYPIP